MSAWVGSGVSLHDPDTDDWEAGAAHVYPCTPMPDMEHAPGSDYSTCYPCDGCWCCAEGLCRQVVSERHTDGSPAVILHGTLPRA